MTVLKPFSGSAGECVKCGSTKAQTQFVLNAQLDRYQYLVPETEPERREMLLRICSECGFKWAEACLA